MINLNSFLQYLRFWFKSSNFEIKNKSRSKTFNFVSISSNSFWKNFSNDKAQASDQKAPISDKNTISRQITRFKSEGPFSIIKHHFLNQKSDLRVKKFHHENNSYFSVFEKFDEVWKNSQLIWRWSNYKDSNVIYWRKNQVIHLVSGQWNPFSVEISIQNLMEETFF